MPVVSIIIGSHTPSDAVKWASDTVRHRHVWSRFAPFLPPDPPAGRRAAHRGKEEEKEGIWKSQVAYSHHLRGGGFSLNSPIGLSLNELSPCAPRFFLFVKKIIPHFSA